jgi:hypothetical protein
MEKGTGAPAGGLTIFPFWFMNGATFILRFPVGKKERETQKEKHMKKLLTAVFALAVSAQVFAGGG